MASESAGHRHVVLLVDDYDDTREALALVLRRRGFDVAAAWSAEDALRHFREGLRPCVALLDLRMPGMDGWQLWARMQDEPDPAIARLPVVIISGDTAQRERAHGVGVCEFLTKPVSHEQLCGVVERYCARSGAA